MVSLRAGLPADSSSITGEKLYLPQEVQTRVLAHSASYVIDTHGSSHVVKRRGQEDVHSTPSLVEVKKKCCYSYASP